jgi:hypothetical protein
MKRGFALVSILVAVASDPAPARACADCLLHDEVFAGVDDSGRLATVSEESTGESDYQSVWLLRISRGTSVVCTADVAVDEKSISYMLIGDQDCERVLDLHAKQRDPERASGRERFYGGKKIGRADLIGKVRARFSDALTPVPSPAGVGIEPVANADGYTGEMREQPLTIDGVQVGHVTAGASRWALSAYTNARFDGVVFRMVTLIGWPDQPLGSSSRCTDYYDGYLAVPRNRIEAARLIAQARAAPTPAESLALARRGRARSRLERRAERAAPSAATRQDHDRAALELD